jgi:DNA-binding CsgD family transcriptional regulator
MQHKNYSPRNWPKRFWDKVKIGSQEECWEWQGAHLGVGYGGIRVYDGSKYAHRISFELSIGPIPPDKLVMHICDNRLCVNPSHLRLGTPQENTVDMYSKNRGYRATGVKHHNAKLTDEIVLKIRLDTRSSKEIARELNMHPRTIESARKGITWAHVRQPGSLREQDS